MLLQFEHQCMRFENKGSGKSCGQYIIGHTKERCNCEMDGSVSEACSSCGMAYSVHETLLGPLQSCHNTPLQCCSIRDLECGGGVLCSPLSSHDRCPAPATAALLLALGPNHNHNVVLSSDIFSKHKPAILNGNYAVD